MHHLVGYLTLLRVSLLKIEPKLLTPPVIILKMQQDQRDGGSCCDSKNNSELSANIMFWDLEAQSCGLSSSWEIQGTVELPPEAKWGYKR